MSFKKFPKDFLFRRQFLLSPEVCHFFNDWQKLNVGRFYLYVHPDLEITTATSVDETVTLVLVGYMINPNNPKKTNAEILNEIIKYESKIELISDFFRFVSGRFVLLVKTVEDIFLFHDPCGLRTVYFSIINGRKYVGSDPNIINKVTPLRKGERFYSYANSNYVKDNIEHWIPAGCSLYEEVQQLIPNHYLSLSSLKQIRYWPRDVLSNRQLGEVVTYASELLVNILKAIHNRFKLALPLTAGWDSRILLAASNPIKDDIYFYTLQYRNLNSKSYDIKIPIRLMSALGLRHHLISCKNEMSGEFRKIYKENTSLSHLEDWGKIAYGMFEFYPDDRVCVKGNCSEIVRCFYYKNGVHEIIDSQDQLIKLENGWSTIPFISDQVSNWFENAQYVCAGTKVDILDLFYWEHRMGNWQAQGQLEWDIVQEVFTPFNNRALMELMLGVKAKYRSAPNYELYQLIINALWPEVMRQDINPTSTKDKFKDILKRLGVLETVSSLYNRIGRK